MVKVPVAACYEGNFVILSKLRFLLDRMGDWSRQRATVMTFLNSLTESILRKFKSIISE